MRGTTFKHRIAEVHANSIKWLSKIESADNPSYELATNSRRRSDG